MGRGLLRPNFRHLLREGQLLFTYLHLAPDPVQAEGLLKSGCTAIAYETVTGPNNTLPLLSPTIFFQVVTGIIGTFLGVRSPGTAYVLLHHYMGEIDGAFRSWGLSRGGTGAVS